MDRFKGVDSFEDYLYSGMVKDSSTYLTEARSIDYSCQSLKYLI